MEVHQQVRAWGRPAYMMRVEVAEQGQLVGRQGDAGEDQGFADGIIRHGDGLEEAAGRPRA
jgi:hypothetical protein